MDKSLKEKATTINNGVDFLTNPDNVAIIETNDTTDTDSDHYIAQAAEMNIEIGKAELDIKGITENQNNARGVLGKYMFEKICSPSLRYAREINDKNVKAYFNFTENKLTKYPLSGVVPFCNNIFNKSEALLSSDSTYTTITGITSGIITAGRAKLTLVEGFLGMPINARKAKGIALRNVKRIQDGIFDYDFENLYNDASFFVDAHPDFAKALRELSGITDLPTHHTGIFGVMSAENGDPIIGGQMVNLDLPKRKAVVSDNLGNYKDEIFRAGLYRFKYSHPDYIDVIITLKINRGMKVQQDVILKKKP